MPRWVWISGLVVIALLIFRSIGAKARANLGKA
jgi:hypothetical protein